MVALSVCFPWKRINRPPSDAQISTFKTHHHLGVSHSCLDLQMVKKSNVRSVTLLHTKSHMPRCEHKTPGPFLPELCPLQWDPEWLLPVWERREVRAPQRHTLLYCTLTVLCLYFFTKWRFVATLCQAGPPGPFPYRLRWGLAFFSNKVFLIKICTELVLDMMLLLTSQTTAECTLLHAPGSQ